MSKTYLVRAAITPAERQRIQLDAIRAGQKQQDYVAELLRAGMAARKDGRK